MADARGDAEEQLEQTLYRLSRHLDGPVVWLRLASESSPLIGFLFCVCNLSAVNRLLAGTDVAALQMMYNRALTLTVLGMIIGMVGWVIGLIIDHRRRNVERAQQTIAREVRGLLAGVEPEP